MCLAIPGQIVEIFGTEPEFLSAKADFGGIRKEISLAFTPEASIGDYVLVHVGFALTVISEQEAKNTFEFLQELASEEDLAKELGGDT